MPEHYDYDAIIIGAGISGLVCGCYLAKAGLKTLIVEKNAKPGGYCTSFTRQGFHFDACAHALSSLRKSGRLSRVINDFNLTEEMNIIRYDPSDVIITPKHKIEIFNDPNKTIDSFKNNFPKEKKQIEYFFNFIISSPTSALLKMRSKTFKEILEFHFKDKELITILSTMAFLIVGLEPQYLSAVVASFFIKEFIFDGGYYPKGGMQTFSDILLKKFVLLKGKVLLSKIVKRIVIEENLARGIILSNGTYITGRYIISASDVRNTFFNLIERDKLDQSILKKISLMKISSSGFLVYLGIDRYFDGFQKFKANYYVINNLKFNTIYSKYKEYNNEHLSITSPSVKDSTQTNRISLCLNSNCIYGIKNYWGYKNKIQLANKFISLTEKVIPGISKNIVFNYIATPVTLYNWTLNFEGAAFGWASTREQFQNPEISGRTKITNLFLTGHWTNLSSGIPFVATSAYNISDLILHKHKYKL